ncbi:MAG: phenylalanine--tRNA ligase subunit beta [Saprospirales bacterium]|nr:phenylalanine--tRNA ligase subunit beta [Saprospirales bacterium]
MTISLNWLRQYIDTDLGAEEIADMLTSLGLEVEGMEEVESIKGGLKGVVIGEVLEAKKHPNADRLSLTRVNIGKDEPLQIVCGAPNVAAGQKVPVALVGTTLYPSDGEPLTLKKGKIRGEVSEGMICAEDELGLGTDHSGIMVLPDEAKVGTPASEFFKVEKDVIFEIGLTPNRSDATCHIGVAKDLAAALRFRNNQEAKVRMPDVSNFPENAEDRIPVEVIVENTEACPRYAGVVITGLQIGESPDWLKNRLRAVGVRPISNIVDITNFILHELGQPLHAFDLDAITGRTIRVKTLAEGTKFISLDEQERSLSAEDLMICDGDTNPMCIGGVFGGLNSGVKDGTTAIFLESAHFNPTYIRRSSTRHNLRTDAAKVFEKGSDPNICVYALKRAAMMMVELAGGEIASKVVDIYPNPVVPKQVTCTYDYVNRLIGTDMSKEDIHKVLEALEMPIVAEDEERFTVAVPTNKADVTRPADVVEEILRVYGLDNVPVPGQMRISMIRNEYPEANQVKNTIADYLASNGFHEIMSLSLTQSTYFKGILPKEEDELVFINNTSNATLDVMRPTMLFSGLEAIVHNQSRQQTDLKLFEFGKTYLRKTDAGTDEKDVTKLFNETQHLSLFLSGRKWAESWRIKEKPEPRSDFFTLKTFVINILDRLGIKGYQQSEANSEALAYGMRFHRGPQELVVFGKVKPSLSKKAGARDEVFMADFNWDLLLKLAGKQNIAFHEPGRFPSTRRDLALIIGSDVKFEDLVKLAGKTEKKLLKQVNLFDVYEDEEKLGKGKKSYAISFVFQHDERTLKDKEVDKIMDQLIRVYEEKLGAVVRK